ncbi:hypothetical protein BDW62DRAFT_209874 [Aspergillus aurantiobrunneus]
MNFKRVHAESHPLTALFRGAAYNDASTVPVLASTGKISWTYNWAVSSNGITGVEFVPMIWGPRPSEADLTQIDSAVRNGSTHILGLNEPDLHEQAAMSPSDAAYAYRRYITPFVDRAQLVSPAVSNGDQKGIGLDWMGKFLDLCSDCQISVMAVHWYGDSAESFKQYIMRSQEFAAQYGLAELWVTEFALNRDVNGIFPDFESSVEFLGQVLPWLDQRCGVARYSYFMSANRFLLDGASLSQAGQAYVA